MSVSPPFLPHFLPPSLPSSVPPSLLAPFLGILSFFALQAGARKVYAIEASSMAVHCLELVRNNRFGDKMVVIAGKLEEVCVSE